MKKDRGLRSLGSTPVLTGSQRFLSYQNKVSCMGSLKHWFKATLVLFYECKSTQIMINCCRFHQVMLFMLTSTDLDLICASIGSWKYRTLWNLSASLRVSIYSLSLSLRHIPVSSIVWSKDINMVFLVINTFWWLLFSFLLVFAII